MPDFDFVVIGGGSGGVASARRAGGYGAKVAIVEDDRLGGTCVNRGCIPKKLYSYAAHFRDEVADAAGYGFSVGEVGFDWATLVANKETELTRLNGIYQRLLEGSGVEIVRGRGHIADPRTVVVGGRRLSAKHILVATGGRPQKPAIPGIEHALVSDQIFDLPRLPGRIVVVGGGYIAVEFAGIFNGLGATTTLLYRGAMVLRGFDDDVRRHLTEEMTRKGVDIRTNTQVRAIRREGDGSLVVETGGGAIAAGVVLYATGRIPNTSGLGLAEAGVRLGDKGQVMVDHWSRSSVATIFAVGDCTDRVNLTPVAIHEGRALAETLFNDNPRPVDHRDIPTAVFSQPPIGTVGLTEAAARATHAVVDVYQATFTPLKQSISPRKERTLMKLVVDRRSDRVLGCHMVGADAAEIIQGFGVAIKCRATKAQFDATMAIHPTAAEEFVTMREPVKAPLAKAAE
ncbi:MAG: glutathione-disulfide reductase [Alphaproteobacteria bacterium]|nr:glutathione-disulfide reductase [Alphaproteobacteria bacterium]